MKHIFVGLDASLDLTCSYALFQRLPTLCYLPEFEICLPVHITGPAHSMLSSRVYDWCAWPVTGSYLLYVIFQSLSLACISVLLPTPCYFPEFETGLSGRIVGRYGESD